MKTIGVDQVYIKIDDRSVYERNPHYVFDEKEKKQLKIISKYELEKSGNGGELILTISE